MKVTGLQPDTEYVFEVEAVNRIGQAASFELVIASTNAKPVEPGQIRNLIREGNLLTWEAPENLADASYEIWVNGALRAKTTETAWTLEAEDGKTYTVSIFAVNESGEKSLPFSLTFLLEEVPEAVTIESVEALAPIEAAYGTAFEILPLPAHVWVILSSGQRVSMEVTWEQRGYQADHPGMQKLTGELRAADGIENVKGLKAEIAVTVKEPSQQPDTPEPGDNGQQPTNPDGENPGQTNPGQNVEQAPEPVKSLKQKAQGTTWITLTWKKSADADGYLIYSRKAGEKREKLAVTVTAGSANTCKVRKLKQAQTYTFRVVPYKDANGKRLLGTAQSKKVSTATKAPKIKGKILASGGVGISWKKVKKSSGYEIVMSGKKKKGYKKVGTLRRASAVKFNKKKGLKKGKAYYFKVRTYRKVGKTKIYSAYSKAIRIRL